MIVPGSPTALLLASAADPLDERLAIGHSVRFNTPDAAYLARTPAGVGSQTTWTWSGWIKRGVLGGTVNLFHAETAGTTYSVLQFSSDNLLIDVRNGGAVVGNKYTSALYRDPASHMHVVCVWDSNNATAADRIRLYADGIRISSFGTSNDPISGSLSYGVNSVNEHRIGAGTTFANYFSGYLSDIHCIDGQALTPDSFGFTHPKTGQWRPKRFTGTYGANGFHLDFSDGSAATSSALGKDRSGNNNDWTPTNISVTAGATNDWLLDTPTNNFCTWNPTAPLLSGAANSPITDGNLKAVSAQAVAWESVKGATLPYGKWYFEFTAIGSAAATTGYRSIALQPNMVQNMGDSSPGFYTTAVGYALALYPNAGNPSANPVGFWSNNVRTAIDADISADADGTVYMMAVDMTLGDGANKVWWGRAGTWFNSGNPSTGANAAYSTLPNNLNIVQSLLCIAGNGLAMNAGQHSYAHTAPTGFKGVGSKHYVKPTTLAKSTNGFVAVTDSGANIQTTLAAARAGWTNYIEIFKRREAAEGWRWRFSSDLANYLDSSSTAAKAAFPSLTGTSYVGYALNVKPSCGIATGTFVHVNGVADTITDGLGQTRKMILLKREDSTSDWLVYHPDLTAGKLLYLNLVSAETVDASIGTVLSNSFVAAAALASGTYRWVALAEVEGFLKLSGYTGNGSADGPFLATSMRPGLSFTHRKDSTSNWYVMDAASDPINPTGNTLYFENTNPAGGSAIDVVSNGVKIRNADGSDNFNTGTFIDVAIAAFPFRYANAR